MPELNFNMLAQQGPQTFMQGLVQGQDIRNRMIDQQQAQDLNSLRIQSGRADLEQLQQDRAERDQLKQQLAAQGQDPDPRKFMQTMIATGNPDHVKMGYEGLRKLDELDKFEKIMGVGAQPQAAAPATPTTPGAPTAPVASRFDPQQIAQTTDRVNQLLALGTPQAIQAAQVLQSQLKGASTPGDRYKAVGNSLFDVGTGQWVKPAAGVAVGGGGATGTAKAAPAGTGDDALIAKALADRRLDISQLTSKNKPAVAATLRTNPDHDFRTSGLEYKGAAAGIRALGTSEAKIVQASSEAKSMLQIAQDYVPRINPSNYPAVNAAGNYVAKNTGDPAQTGFATALNGLVNTYARAINPSGVATVSDKNHAREIIDKAMSSGQFNEVFRVMNQEMDASLASPTKARKALGYIKDEAKVPAGRTAAPVQNAPSVGTIQDGYRFKGGNPADPKSWEKQ